jgi:hypothetical protein
VWQSVKSQSKNYNGLPNLAVGRARDLLSKAEDGVTFNWAISKAKNLFQLG